MPNYDLALLPAFVAVAELGSFSAAAKRLGVEKSSASRSVARLEAALSTRLLHRTTRRVTLSAAGAALYDTVVGPAGALQSALSGVLDNDGSPTGRLRVTAPVDLGLVTSESIARFTQRYPRVDVELRLTSEVVDLVAESFDVAVRVATRPLRDSSLHARSIGRLRLGIFASPIYLARRGTPRSPEQLAAHEWVVFSVARRVQLNRDRDSVVIPTTGRVVCDDMLFLLHAVRQGIGLGVLPLFLVEQEVAAGKLVPLAPAWHAMGGQIWLVTPAGRKASKSVATFVECIETTLAAHGSVAAR